MVYSDCEWKSFCHLKTSIISCHNFLVTKPAIKQENVVC